MQHVEGRLSLQALAGMRLEREAETFNGA